VTRVLVPILFALLAASCADGPVRSDVQTPSKRENVRRSEITSAPVKHIVENAFEQTKITKNYSQEYFNLPYPNGDPPIETGACTDVVIRAFRKAGVDLQKEVHEDMATNFGAYPKKWGLARTNTNIDHRRVPNLQTFFERRKKSIAVTNSAKDYQPGDVVTWDLDGKGTTHIGLVSNVWNAAGDRYLIVHNIGAGTRAEDVLFNWKVTGHYRYF
jgi:uncharacterized protein YijF (DUF1287 family)